jgi:hypothetical protein
MAMAAAKAKPKQKVQRIWARAPEAKAEIAAANDYVVVTDIEIINPIRGAT